MVLNHPKPSRACASFFARGGLFILSGGPSFSKLSKRPIMIVYMYFEIVSGEYGNQSTLLSFIFFVNIVKEGNSSYFLGYLTHEAPDLLQTASSVLFFFSVTVDQKSHRWGEGGERTKL